MVNFAEAGDKIVVIKITNKQGRYRKEQRKPKKEKNSTLEGGKPGNLERGAILKIPKV